MLTSDVLEVPKFYVSVFGLVLSLIGGALALQSFRRNERWKKAEFLAKEMKDFFEETRTQKALLFIDWGTRRVQLFSPDADDGGRIIVTRALQVSALRPHTFLRTNGSDPAMNIEEADSDVETDGEASDSSPKSFSPAEAAIRDCYDGFLDGLERLSSYVKTGLIETPALRPYIGYWIDDIHAATTNKIDAAWSAALLTYISFYRFDGVLWLFEALDRDIKPSSSSLSQLP